VVSRYNIDKALSNTKGVSKKGQLGKMKACQQPRSQQPQFQVVIQLTTSAAGQLFCMTE
jgi:hypothetical protein